MGLHLTVVPASDEWRDHAACRDTDPDLFFPVGTTGAALDQIEAAKRVCMECPVTSECAEFAVITNQDTGIWGGTSEEDRRLERKRQRAAAS